MPLLSLTAELKAKLRAKRAEKGRAANHYAGLPPDAVHICGSIGTESFLTLSGRMFRFEYDLIDPEKNQLIEMEQPLDIALFLREAGRIFPELLDWMPKRLPNAANCEHCEGTGLLFHKFLEGSPYADWPCFACAGLGFIP